MIFKKTTLKHKKKCYIILSLMHSSPPLPTELFKFPTAMHWQLRKSSSESLILKTSPRPFISGTSNFYLFKVLILKVKAHPKLSDCILIGYILR